MKRRWKLLAVLLGLPLSWMALVASGWLPRLRAEDVAAVTMLSQPAALTGERNAFALLQSFDRDVPESDWERVAAEQMAKVSGRTLLDGYSLQAGAEYPAYPALPPALKEVCTSWGGQCLSAVRAHTDAVREHLAQAGARLARGERLLDYDYYRYDGPLRVDSPIMTVSGYFNQLLMSIALKHVDGDSAAALDQLCRHVAGWRRLRGQTDMLILDMLGTAFVSGGTTLYADILAELPADYSPPCPQTFAPLDDRELQLCPIVHAEFQSYQASAQVLGADVVLAVNGETTLLGRLGSLFDNPAHRDAIVARTLARYCGEAHLARVRARASGPALQPLACSMEEWLFDPPSCLLGDLMVDYDPYYHRQLDLDGRLRLLNLAMHLRGLDADAAERAFAEREASLRSSAHEMQIDSATQVVRMRPLDRARGKVWEFSYASAH